MTDYKEPNVVLTMEDIKKTIKLCKYNSSSHHESMQDFERLIALHKAANGEENETKTQKADYEI